MTTTRIRKRLEYLWGEIEGTVLHVPNGRYEVSWALETELDLEREPFQRGDHETPATL